MNQNKYKDFYREITCWDDKIYCVWFASSSSCCDINVFCNEL